MDGQLQITVSQAGVSAPGMPAVWAIRSASLDLTELQQRILEALQGKRLNLTALAKAIGKNRTSLYRGVLQPLLDAGLVVRERGVYFLDRFSP